MWVDGLFDGVWFGVVFVCVFDEFVFVVYVECMCVLFVVVLDGCDVVVGFIEWFVFRCGCLVVWVDVVVVGV